MKDIATILSNDNLNNDKNKFNKFLKEYGHEVFLRILSKSMFISLAFVLFSAILTSKMASKDVALFSLLVSFLMIIAYGVGKIIKVKYTWIFQCGLYILSSYIMLRIYLVDTIDIDFKIVIVFFVFLFSIAIKNPYAHMMSVFINSIIGFVYFNKHGIITFLNVNDQIVMFIIVFSVTFMNFRNYKALKAEFFENQKYIAKSTLISSIGNRYDIESYKNMAEESAINESLYKYKLFFDGTFNLYMIFDRNNVYDINDGLLNLLGVDRDTFELRELKDIIDFDDVIKKSNTFENSNQKFKIEDRELFINAVVTEIEYDAKKLYMLSGYDNTSNVMINKKMEKSLQMREKIVELNRAIIEEDSICDTLNKIINITVSVIKSASYGSVLIYDESTGYLNIECFRGYESEIISDFKVKLEESFIYNITDGKLDRSVLSESLGSSGLVKVKNVLNKDDHIVITSTISSPLYLNGNFYGLVCVDSSGDEKFDESDVQSVEYIRNQIEIALGKKLVFDEVKKLSNTDVLTGTFNRRYFENVIYKMLEDEKLEVYHFVVIDLDNLKIINDNYGHAFGDLYINGFVEKLRKYMRSEDYIVRSGGDEFTLTFKHLPIELLKKRLEEITMDLDKNPIVYENEKISIKFSYGIASYPVDSRSRDELLEIADDNMYEMKKLNKSKNGVK